MTDPDAQLRARIAGMTDDEVRNEGAAIYRELRPVPGYAFPAGDPAEWTREQSERAVLEGSTSADDPWITERLRLIEAGELEL